VFITAFGYVILHQIKTLYQKIGNIFRKLW